MPGPTFSSTAFSDLSPPCAVRAASGLRAQLLAIPKDAKHRPAPARWAYCASGLDDDAEFQSGHFPC